MIGMLLSLALSRHAGLPAGRDSARVLSGDELAVYTVTIRDFALSVVPTPPETRVNFALDPFEYPDPSTAARGGAPKSFPRLSDSSVRALTRAAGILEVCEPGPDASCRGSVRGAVLRLSGIRFASPDSAELILTRTSARSEFDNTAMAPEVRYYGYALARQDGRWKIRRARRGLPGLPGL